MKSISNSIWAVLLIVLLILILSVSVLISNREGSEALILVVGAVFMISVLEVTEYILEGKRAINTLVVQFFLFAIGIIACFYHVGVRIELVW